ncbi:MAG: hypothetical protein HY549_07340 [Elusimicrobia bacterium]|nr:hypothetical protein [Elusimicrobiota bacterium]
MPNKYPDVRRQLRREDGILIPAALFLTLFITVFILLTAQRILRQSKDSVMLSQSAGGSAGAQGGIQLGMARLALRLSHVSDRVTNGTPSGPGVRWMSEGDMQRYTSLRPADFWTDNLLGFALSDETDFASPDGGQTAVFGIDNSTHAVTVRLIFAGYSLGSSGYNDVTLRYGFEIISTDKKTGLVSRAKSYLSTPDYNISVRLQRPLSRYNLFAMFNTFPPALGGAPVYDGASYTGPIYSENTLYVQGAGPPGSPSYADDIEISTAASPAYVHRTDGGFTLRHPDGSANNPIRVDAQAFPGSLDAEEHKKTAFWGFTGAPNLPVGLDANSIFAASSLVPRVSGDVILSTVSVYVSGDARIWMDELGPGVESTTFYISCPPAAAPVPVPLLVAELSVPQLLIYVDGSLLLKGAVSQRSKITIASRDDLVLIGSVTYANGAMPSSVTVVGLVSWNGNILISNGIESEDLTLQAVIMAPTGGFGAQGFENFPANYSEYKGTVRHTGAFIRRYALPTLSSDLTLGWGMTTQYDGDLRSNKSPPYFPGAGHYELADPQKVKVVDLFHVF